MRYCLGLSLITAWACALAAQQNLSRPVELATIPVDIQSPAYRLGFGRVIAIDRDQTLLKVFGPQGQLLTTVPVRVPDATKTIIKDAAASPSGGVAALLSSMNKDGALAALLIFADDKGKLTRIVRTNPYSPMHLAFSADGVLWTAGRVFDEKFREAAAYDVVRRFSGQGLEIGSSLPRTALPPTERFHPAHGSYFVRTGMGMMLYSPEASRSAEFADTGELKKVSAVDGFPMKWMVHGAAFLDGALYVSIQVTGENGPTLRLFQLQPDGSWNAVATDRLVPREINATLLGVHTNRLVFLSGNQLLFSTPE